MPDRALSPPAVAERLGVSPAKILNWIDSGELKAINVAASSRGQRPRWRITPEALAAFEAGRANAPAPPTPRPRRRRADSTVIEFY